MNRDPRVDVLGVPVSATSMEQALDRVEGWIRARDPHYVTFTGVHGVMECQADPELARIHRGAGMVAPDGMPMVWASKLAGVKDTTRVYGPDFLLAMAERAAREGYTSFFYGGNEGVADELAASLAERFPGFRCVGTYCPPFRPLTDDEVGEVVELVRAAEPDMVWVGLSTPKQERWMAQFVDKLDGPVLLGVGAAFDIHSGNLSQAPLWMQRNGLEWLYRLGVEPKRLWKRYLVNNPRFVAKVARRRPRLLPADERPDRDGDGGRPDAGPTDLAS
jgi:N-acetylglucosaminyldiphosphoundecaprenol N-acetyl-beta-D-mannosaminyltransferase